MAKDPTRADQKLSKEKYEVSQEIGAVTRLSNVTKQKNKKTNK